MFAPLSLDLPGLFPDPDMFDSPKHWQGAGFEVRGEGAASDIMVASHPSAVGHLFKRYSRKISLKDQLENYRRRVEGATKLRAFIQRHGLSRIVVPQKHLHELPPAFGSNGVPSCVLIVEQMVLLTSSQSKKLYQRIDDETLRQLCLVLRNFQGLDSGVRNVPFTSGGQIAFVDTERWSDRKKEPLRHLREYLSREQQHRALKLFEAA